MNEFEQRRAAFEFKEEWKDEGYEKGQAQSFWIELLSKVFGIENIKDFIKFEERVLMDSSTGFMDGYIEHTKVLVEQKSINVDLRKNIKKPDGSVETPFQQAKRYIANLPYFKHPRWVVLSNFKSFLIYDMNKPHEEPEEILLENLDKEYHLLKFLVDPSKKRVKKELEISIKAGDLVGKLYDLFHEQYINKNNPESLRSLNKLCVRIVFCLYAEDAGLFGKKAAFHDYLARFDVNDMRRALIDLFKILNTEEVNRDPYLDVGLAQFPYVNGGLFEEDEIEIPNFTEEIRETLLARASDDFDWSEISPTIFGAVFESTLNPETRRSGGMHYTSIENIHKVIDPLFLNDINEELNRIRKYKNKKTRDEKLREFQTKLSKHKFLDPACGSGNFLTETFLSLRRIENEIIEMINEGQQIMDIGDVIKVDIHQFYGIEINDFAVSVATTALWIAESQMIRETESIVNIKIEYLPLTEYNNIVEANALRIDWNDVIPASELDYIMGNPPFIGATFMAPQQRRELEEVFDGIKNTGKFDYVTAWFKKSIIYMGNDNIKSALVSTSSISEGQHVLTFWKHMFENHNISINFAYKTFEWTNETDKVAGVHCVIIGFKIKEKHDIYKLYSDINNFKIVRNINAYLVDGPNLIIGARSNPISDVTKMTVGSRPNDGGKLMVTKTEYEENIKKDPSIKRFLKRAISGGDFINNNIRYCLWLKDAQPHEINKSLFIKNKIREVRNHRLASEIQSTKDLAKTPHLFQADRQPTTKFLFIPQLSSHNRDYIPIGFLTPNYVPLDPHFVVEKASYYDFGVITSKVHMNWIRIIAGRFKSDYRYSNTMVYNTFPWPDIDVKQKEKIKKTAQGILDARELYPDSSLADLYNELTMPKELRTAHELNDKAVMEAYGFKSNMTESEIVAELMKLYQKLVAEER